MSVSLSDANCWKQDKWLCRLLTQFVLFMFCLAEPNGFGVVKKRKSQACTLFLVTVE